MSHEQNDRYLEDIEMMETDIRDANAGLDTSLNATLVNLQDTIQMVENIRKMEQSLREYRSRA